MQQSDAERENKECAYDQEEEKKQSWKVHWGLRFLWRALLVLTAGDQRELCVMRGRQRLFKACQPGSILSHSYLVCLDRHSTKGEGRKRQQGTTGMRIEWHCITAGSEDLCCHFWAVKGSEEPTVTQSQNLSVDYVQLSVILFLRFSESANNS